MHRLSDIFIYCCNRCPGFANNISNSVNQSDDNLMDKLNIDNLYINVSQLASSILGRCAIYSSKDLALELNAELDKIVKLVRPKKVLFLSMDGTKPAAKLNHERAQLYELSKQPIAVPTPTTTTSEVEKERMSLLHFLPGTDGNEELMLHLQRAVKERMRAIDSAVGQLQPQEQQESGLLYNALHKVLFADSTVPGDALQKISEFIRSQRASENYPPNTKHCLVDCSEEAFCCALASHEPYFYILSEQIVASQALMCIQCGVQGHSYFSNNCPENQKQNLLHQQQQYPLQQQQQQNLTTMQQPQKQEQQLISCAQPQEQYQQQSSSQTQLEQEQQQLQQPQPQQDVMQVEVQDNQESKESQDKQNQQIQQDSQEPQNQQVEQDSQKPKNQQIQQDSQDPMNKQVQQDSQEPENYQEQQDQQEPQKEKKTLENQPEPKEQVQSEAEGARESIDVEEPSVEKVPAKADYQLFNFKELRQFINLQFRFLQLGFGFNLERVIDDFALLVLLMGSQVVPPLPFLSYLDLGFDCILYIYKRILPYLEGYITDGGEIDFARLSMLFKDIGFSEEIMVKNLQRVHFYNSRRNKWQLNSWKEFINEKIIELNQIEVSDSDDDADSKPNSTDFSNSKQDQSDQLQLQQSQQFPQQQVQLPQQTPQQQQQQLSQQSLSQQPSLQQQQQQQSQQPSQQQAPPLQGVQEDISPQYEPFYEQVNSSEQQLDEKAVSNPTEKQNQDQQAMVGNSLQQSQQLFPQTQQKVPPRSSSNSPPSQQQIIQKNYDMYLNSEKNKQIQIRVLENSYQCFEEVLVDYSKYAERFFEGISTSQLLDQTSTTSDSSSSTLLQQKPLYSAMNNISSLSSCNASGNLEKFLETKEIAESVDITELLNQKKIQANQKVENVAEKSFKLQFYMKKCGIQVSDYFQFKQLIQTAYVEGLYLAYSQFYRGVVSWKWQYPLAFAPFASDLDNVDRQSIKLELGESYKQLDYLLAITSHRTKRLLPKTYQHILDDSEIVDFWPMDFRRETDWLNRQVYLLPTLDLNLLAQITSKYESFLPDEVQRRNKKGRVLLLTKGKNALGSNSEESSQQQQQQQQPTVGEETQIQQQQLIRRRLTILQQGLSGEAFLIEEGNEANHDISTYSFLFQQTARHQSMLLPGTNIDESFDFNLTQLDAYDNLIYSQNPIIKMLERVIRSQSDKNELYNRGLAGRDDLQPMHKPVSNSSSGGGNQSSNSQRNNQHGGNNKGGNNYNQKNQFTSPQQHQHNYPRGHQNQRNKQGQTGNQYSGSGGGNQNINKRGYPQQYSYPQNLKQQPYKRNQSNKNQ